MSLLDKLSEECLQSVVLTSHHNAGCKVGGVPSVLYSTFQSNIRAKAAPSRLFFVESFDDLLTSDLSV